MSKKTKVALPASSPRVLEGEVIPAGDTQRETKQPEHPIAITLARFLLAADDYRDALSIAMPAVARKRADDINKNVVKLQRFVSKSREDGTSDLFAHGPHAARDMLDSIRTQERLTHSRILPLMERSFFIGLFSEYDSFIGSLLKAIYSRKPALYKGIKREIALTELLSFQNLDDVKKDMLEKEIDSFRRESYIEQFSELERKFELKTLRAFPEWTRFVEISQRRNVMTHNDGRVSQQYIMVCEKEGVKFDTKPLIGDELELTPNYLFDAIFVVSKVSYMLAHVLWRKVLVDEIKEANEAMNETVYELLMRKQWITAAAFGEFGLTDPMTKGIEDIVQRIRVINTAIGLKHAKRQSDANALLNSCDWSACIRDFKLANAVLKEAYPEAAQIMRDIGKKGELVHQLAYHDWPLFEEFRGRREFQDAYEELYKVPFLEKVSNEAQEISKNLKRDKPGKLTSLIRSRTKSATPNKVKKAATKKKVIVH